MDKPVSLSDQEWQAIINILGDAPWKVAHPLLMKIGGQLREQTNSGSSAMEAHDQAH